MHNDGECASPASATLAQPCGRFAAVAQIDSCRVAEGWESGTAVIKVLMASTSYPSTRADWKGVFIAHLTDALAGCPDLALSVWCPPGSMAPAVHQAMSDDDRAWLTDLMASGGIAHQMRNGGLRGKLKMVALLARLRKAYRRVDADVRHVNWLQNALPLPNDRVPLLTTVLGTDMQLLALPGMATLLRRVFRRRPTVISPNAEWMVPELERRFGAVANIRYVPFGIDRGWYEIDRAGVDGAHWICVSRVTRAKLGHLVDWFAPLAASKGLRLSLIGPMQEQVELPKWVDYRGPASVSDLMQNWFPRVAGLITMSEHAEGRPQVMLEAMAAGLPIVASDIPAHRDLLEDGVTGLLCRDRNEMTSALMKLGDKSYGARIGLAARQWTAANIGTWDDCAARYVRLYESLRRKADA